jgi:outer membrane protein assembly factor BamE (lipoprotein component of BamABCDE complex)
MLRRQGTIRQFMGTQVSIAMKSRFSMIGKAAILTGALAALGACSSIRESRGYVTDNVLLRSVQPGIDNQRSVEGTLGRPSFTSQYGEPTWYYVSSVTGRKPFVRPRIKTHGVLAVRFDEAGNVSSVDRTGVDKVVYLRPNGDKTPTLGRERGFLEDLFGNIGQVGAAGGPGGAGPGGP